MEQRQARKLVHTESIPVRWGDMDAMGHVNNTVYFRYMEQARISWFDVLLPRGEVRGSIGMVIVSTSCNYKKPIGYPATVDVKLYAAPPGGSSVGTYYELLVGDTLYADGEAVVVFVDTARNMPTRIPEGVRALMQ